ncbi:MAG TPA: hypothetical protein VHL31_07555 [Geminicoccus sp.]|jgi:hypothetical protein|nr:hypothetical protein [Geminicoccus sp.]HEX2526143.1 hypothetical protein [Geminicoccus sp.]
MLDLAAIRHAAEKGMTPLVLQQSIREFYKCVMNIIGRNSRRDAIEID